MKVEKKNGMSFWFANVSYVLLNFQLILRRNSGVRIQSLSKDIVGAWLKKKKSKKKKSKINKFFSPNLYIFIYTFKLNVLCFWAKISAIIILYYSKYSRLIQIGGSLISDCGPIAPDRRPRSLIEATLWLKGTWCTATNILSKKIENSVPQIRGHKWAPLRTQQAAAAELSQ